MENSALAVVLAIASVISLAGMVYPFKPFGRRWIALVAFLACSILIGIIGSAREAGKTPVASKNEDTGQVFETGDLFRVTSERLNRRTCPSEQCGVVGQFFYREAVPVLEQRDGWARVTKFYDASCKNGRSPYVDSGNAACDPANGIANGHFAEWVSAAFLARSVPPDPAASASGDEGLVAGSDDFGRYRTAFAAAARTLIAQRRCSKQDFLEMGGWVKSTTHRDAPVYFTYCGGATVAHRLYLNAETGETYR